MIGADENFKETAMKKVVKVLLGLVVLALTGAILITALTPWMDRWGATDSEIAAVLPGDELVPVQDGVINRVITINASPEQIYPWIVQMGASKGGMYSYTSIETYMLNCPLVNADRIHSEWQDLKVGDEVKMCPNEPAPPPYIVAQLEPDRAVVLGHQDNGRWVELWQFVIVPQEEGASRLIMRSRSQVTGGIWEVLHPGIFIMQRGMLLGIKERAEAF
jgi:hypothetical protein